MCVYIHIIEAPGACLVWEREGRHQKPSFGCAVIPESSSYCELSRGVPPQKFLNLGWWCNLTPVAVPMGELGWTSTWVHHSSYSLDPCEAWFLCGLTQHQATSQTSSSENSFSEVDRTILEWNEDVISMDFQLSATHVKEEYHYPWIRWINSKIT